MYDGLAGRAILVTGGASGIGRAAGALCAQHGARVALLDRDAAGVATAAAAIAEQSGADVRPYVCDIGDATAVDRTVDAVCADLGTPRGVFACAGIELGGFAHELTTERWRVVVGTNLDGTFFTSRAVLRAMVAGGAGGSLVLCSSPASFVAFSAGGASAYASSKGGISALTRTLAVDYAPHGIRVNAVVPGATDTPLMWVAVPPEEKPRMEGLIASEVPLGRVADPIEPARAAVWLLSDDSSYVTGSHLICDGGILAKGSISF